MPPESSNPGPTTGQTIVTPFQGIGAEGVSTIAARTLLTLFPPNMPMFRMQLNDHELQAANEAAADMEMAEEQKAWETQVQTALSQYERTIQADIEASGDRPSLHEALLHLYVNGNVLLHDGRKPGEGIRVFPLNRFVVRRDPMGSPLEMVVHESVSRNALPQKFLEQLQDMGKGILPTDGSLPSHDEPDLELFTHLTRKGNRWSAYQECEGMVIPGTRATYTLEGCPFIPLRMYWMAGEDYGRSYVENYLGDLRSLEALTQAVIEGSAGSAKIVFLVNPNGTTKAADLERAPNLGFVKGDPNDVQALQVQKAADLRVALEAIQMLNSRLAKAFMLMDGMRRDAERVTAEEIRAVASELEAGFGGLYSMLSQELQLPYILRKIAKNTKAGNVPTLPEGTVKPMVITGFEALGRGNDRQKLVDYLGTVTQALGPQVAMQYLNIPDFLERLATADGINTKGLIKTPQAMQDEQAQAQEQEAMRALGPKAIDAVGKFAASGMNQPQQPDAPIQEGA